VRLCSPFSVMSFITSAEALSVTEEESYTHFLAALCSVAFLPLAPSPLLKLCFTNICMVPQFIRSNAERRCLVGRIISN
jgi:hypothetical protein